MATCCFKRALLYERLSLTFQIHSLSVLPPEKKNGLDNLAELSL